MKLHREGRVTLLIVAILIAVLNYSVARFITIPAIVYSLMALSLILYLFIMYFFRYVERPVIYDKRLILAPCDGKVVVIEEVEEPEYFKDKRIQVSIFMSPLNVHMNWYPVSGKILKAQIHKGSHLVAWAPKSSTHNERSSVVLETPENQQILVRQIAGAVARRVVMYAREGEYIEQGENLGFIKFGSRVDLYLPLGTDIKVKINQNVQGNITEIARFN